MPVIVFFVDWRGKSPNEILINPPQNHSSWHFFQARSWLDYATRENAPSAIHYAAFELRYGIEYLLFELLVLASESLSLEEYKQTIGSPQATKKLLASPPRNYAKLSEFAEVVVSVDPQAPPIQFWNLNDLFRYWGVWHRIFFILSVRTRPVTLRLIGRLKQSLGSIRS